jgi:hypothetical protein
VSGNPEDGTQIVMASTGRGRVFPSDNWGTTYLIDIDLDRKKLKESLDDIYDIQAKISILYDGDDAGDGQFSDPDYWLRSPDNLDWADDGFIYIQEDRSTSPSSFFGAESGIEASVWKLNPENGKKCKSIDKWRRTGGLPVFGH